MFTVNNKFEIGEECWTYYTKNVKCECPVCKGKGKFVYNGYEIGCKQCNQTGKISANQTVVEPCKVKIRRIKVSKWNEAVSIKYCLDSIGNIYINVRNRSEQSLFKTEEEAINKCKSINTGECGSYF